MNKNFNREPVKLKIMFFKKGKNITSENISLFKKKHKIHKIIRLLSTDFNLIKKKMKRLTHFSIQDTAHIAGKKYLIVKIVERGYFNGEFYSPPIFDRKKFILARCFYVKSNIRYKDLKKNVFENSLNNIKNIKNLKKAIKRRYKKSLAHLSDREKISLGVGITKLKIIKRF